jgi:hypothetical protein
MKIGEQSGVSSNAEKNGASGNAYTAGSRPVGSDLRSDKQSRTGSSIAGRFTNSMISKVHCHRAASQCARLLIQPSPPPFPLISVSLVQRLATSDFLFRTFFPLYSALTCIKTFLVSNRTF